VELKGGRIGGRRIVRGGGGGGRGMGRGRREGVRRRSGI